MARKKILNSSRLCTPSNKNISYTKKADEEIAKTRRDVEKIETEIRNIENRIRLLI